MSKKCRPVYGPQCTHTHTHIGLMGHLPCQPEQARYPLNFHSPLPSRLCVLSVQTNSSDILFDIIPPPCLPVCGIYGRRRLLCFVNLSPKLTLPDVVSVTQLLPPGTHFLEQYSKASQQQSSNPGLTQLLIWHRSNSCDVNYATTASEVTTYYYYYYYYYIWRDRNMYIIIIIPRMSPWSRSFHFCNV